MRRCVLLLGALAACDEGTLSVQPDFGGLPDADFVANLPLEENATYTYRATLTYKQSDSDPGTQTIYRIRLNVTQVTDNLGQGPSRLEYRMEDVSAPGDKNAGWTAAFDFSSWVGRLGPSRGPDTVSPSAVEVPLEEAPRLPPAPVATNKDLPHGGTFFVDIRESLAIASAWELAEQPRRTTTDPAAGLVLTSDGMDDRIQFHEDQNLRRVELNYREDGVLDSLFEFINESGVPRTTANLMLVEESS